MNLYCYIYPIVWKLFPSSSPWERGLSHLKAGPVSGSPLYPQGQDSAGHLVDGQSDLFREMSKCSGP